MTLWEGLVIMPVRIPPDTNTYVGRCAARLYMLREKAKLNQEHIAQKLGVTYRTVCRMESGETLISVKHLPILAELFGLESVRDVLAEK